MNSNYNLSWLHRNLYISDSILKYLIIDVLMSETRIDPQSKPEKIVNYTYKYNVHGN